MSWTELDRLADDAARAWAAERGGWPGVVADRSYREGWKDAARAFLADSESEQQRILSLLSKGTSARRSASADV